MTQIKLYGKSIRAPLECRKGMGVEACLDCLLPDCNEKKGRHYLRDERIMADHKTGMSLRDLSEKWGLALQMVERIVRVS